MATPPTDALQPYNRPCVRRRGEENDKLSTLPKEVLVTIMSFLTMTEAGRTSILSQPWRQRWKEMWPHFGGVLNFVYSNSLGFHVNLPVSIFVKWVTHIVEHHVNSSIEGFEVVYDLDNSHKSHIDKWVIFALAKGAKSLVLKLNPRCQLSGDYYTLPPAPECCTPFRPPYNLASSKYGLRTLVLEYVNVTSEVLSCFLQSCPFLENLYILRSPRLTSVSAGDMVLSLKHLEILTCLQMENICISAPKLVKFAYRGPPIQLHIQNACLLSEVTIGVGEHASLAYAFDSLSEYFSQLELLHLHCNLKSGVNLTLPLVSNLTKLKHLIFQIEADFNQLLNQWIRLIEASRALEKLTLLLRSENHRFNDGYDSWSLGCRVNLIPRLKTFEIYGFVGRRIDLDLDRYVLDKAFGLKEVTIDLKMFGHSSIICNSNVGLSKRRAMRLKKKASGDVNFVIRD